VPADLPVSAGPAAATVAQRLVGAYGKLLLSWPSLRAASSALLSPGASLALPL
jgi:hypothetical protein